MIYITKVVSRNFVMDWVAVFQNWFGMNLTTYEKMVMKGMKQIEEDLNKRHILMDWYRIEITQLTTGSVCLTLYGESKNVTH